MLSNRWNGLPQKGEKVAQKGNLCGFLRLFAARNMELESGCELEVTLTGGIFRRCGNHTLPIPPPSNEGGYASRRLRQA